ncbi:MAG: hypothetical protein JXQ75_02205 [Phycisphaerae bacterium]|nr:hypothetical protein [Phycisphaerae bacterium]
MARRTRWKRGLCIIATAVFAGCNVAPTGSVPGSGGGSGGGGSGNVTGGSATLSVSASLLEQLSLERINRARLKPGSEAAAAGIAIDEGIPGQLDTTPKPPVALNDELNQSAETHSQDMLDRDYFEHNAPEGVTPFDRMNAAGYVFTAAGENLAWRGTTGPLDEAATVEGQHEDLFVDAGISGRGHRVTMLNDRFREVGIGIVRGNYTQNGTTFDSIMQTQDYGLSVSDNTFVLGVVYNDANNNNLYDYGEGVSSATVTLASVSKTTNAGGGYSFEVLQAGTYTLRFATGQTQLLTIGNGDPNIKVDLVDGTTVIVNLGLGPLN